MGRISCALIELILAADVAATTLWAARKVDYPGAVPPPPGVTPNLDDPPDAGRISNIVVVALCLGIATLLFFIRVYVKLMISCAVLIEDGMFL